MNDWPNTYDLDTDEEYLETGEKLKRHLRDAERIRGDATLQGAEDQEAIAHEIADFEGLLELSGASRRRRLDFQRRRLIPSEEE